MTNVAIRSRSELRRILLLGLLVIAIVLAAGLGGIAFAARAVDRAVATEERSLVVRTLDRRRAKLVEDITSATVWDDAYLSTVTRFDPQWVDENYGVYYATYMHHDRTLVFGPDGAVIYASDGGEASPPSSQSAFARDVGPLLTAVRRVEAQKHAKGAAPHGLSGAATASALIRSDGALWMVALSTVVPETSKAEQASGPSAVVASGRRLDGAFLATLQEDLGIAGAHLVEPGEAARGMVVPLADRQGRTLGQLGWRPRQPGAGILKDILGPVLLVLAACSRP